MSEQAWTQQDAERENGAFDAWFKERGYPNYPQQYPLVTENAMHAAWQEAAKRKALSAQVKSVARPLSEYHEDSGPVVWWKFPVEEPSYIGCPNSSDWPGYHTHWTPHPAIPAEPTN